MLSLLFALTLAVRENEIRICVCNDACPKICDVFEKILIAETPDLDAEFTKLKRKYMDIRFCHAPGGFRFNVATFDDCDVEFDSFHLSPKAKVIAEVTRASTAELSFNNLDVTFLGYSSSQELTLNSIKLTQVDSRNENLGSRLVTQSFTASNSVYDFADITIKAACPDPAISIDILSGYQLNLVVGANTITLGSSTFHFEGKATASISTKLENVKLTVTGTSEELILPYLILIGFPYTTFSGVYPEQYCIQMQNLKENTVIANEKRLPISLDGAPVNVYVSQPSTIIEGDTSCNVRLYAKAQPAQRYSVEIVKLNGNIDVYSSWIDVVLDIFNPDLDVYVSPFTFCVGKGGVSTIVANNTLYTGKSSMSSFKYHCDFNQYLDDETLRNLLTSEHDVLQIQGDKVQFLTDTVSIIPAESLDIPGFSSISNCVSVSLKSANPFILSLSAVSPTTLPLRLCYAEQLSDCQVDVDGFLINDYSLKDLKENCIYPGIVDVTITLKKDLNSIDFATLDESQTGLSVEIKSSSSGTYALKNILNLSPDHISNLKLTNLLLEGGNINVSTVTINGCDFTGASEGNLTFNDSTKLTVDDSFLLQLAGRASSFNELTINLQKYNNLTIDSDLLEFSDSSSSISTGSLPVQSVNSLTLNIIDVFTINAVTIPKEFTINHDFTEGIHDNELILQNLPQSTSHQITYNHSTHNVELVRRSAIPTDCFNLVGTGEVHIQNEYSSQKSICVSSDNSLCVGYESSQIINPNSIESQLTSETTIVAEIYSDVSLSQSSFGRKSVTFKKGSNSITTPTVTIRTSSSISSSDAEYSTTVFEGLTISFPDSNSVIWGHVQFLNCDISTFTGGITAIDYTATYESLSQVSSLSISGYLSLEGDAQSTKEFTLSSTNPRRLRATIPDGAQVIVSDNAIKINDYQFNIGSVSTDFYDVELSAVPNATFTFSYEGSNINSLPYVYFSLLKSVTVNVRGSWPQTEVGKARVVFGHTQFDFNLNIYSENIPMAFDLIQMNLNMVLYVQQCTIYGHFNTMTERFHEVVISSGQDIENAQLTFAGGIGVDSKSYIKFGNPVTAIVSEVSFIGTSRETTGSISFQHYVSLTSNSYVTIQNQLSNVNFYKNFQVYCDIATSLDDEAVQNFLTKEISLLQVNADDIAKFNVVTSVEFVEPLPSTHGFIGSNFGVEINEQGIVILKNTNNPIHSPVEACYGSGADCEIVITDQNAGTFSTLLPSNVESINIVFSGDTNQTINFNDEKLSGVTLTLQSKSSTVFNIKATFGAGRISKLIAKNVNIQVNDQYTISDGNFTNAVISPHSGFSFLVYDYDSFVQSPVTSSSGTFQLIYPHNSITFNADGWTLEDGTKLNAADFSKVQFNLTTNLELSINVDQDLTSVSDCTLYTNTRHITVGNGWQTVTSPSRINLESSILLEEVIVTAQCYPFNTLPLMNGTTIQFSSSTLPITINEPLTLNDEKLTIDFNLVENNADARLYLNYGITLSGDSKIYFPNSKNTSFPCLTTELTVQDGSSAYAADIQTNRKVAIHGSSTLYSSIDISMATVEFHWWKDHIPTFVAQIDKVPSHLAIYHDGDSSEKDSVKGQSYSLVNVGLNCQQWLSDVEYHGDAEVNLQCQDGVLTMTPTGKSTGLSTGAIIGIVIGCVAFVAIIVFIVIYFVVCRKREGSAKSPSLLSLAEK